MIHLEFNTIRFDGIRNLFQHESFDGSCSQCSSGGPLMIVHKHERIGRLDKNELGLDADQKLDPKLLGGISGDPGVSDFSHLSNLRAGYRLLTV